MVYYVLSLNKETKEVRLNISDIKLDLPKDHFLLQLESTHHICKEMVRELMRDEIDRLLTVLDQIETLAENVD